MAVEPFLAAAEAYVDAVGEEIEYHGGGVPAQEFLAEIRAVVEDEFDVVESGEVSVSSRRPSIYVTLESLPRSPEEQGDQVVVRGETFDVVTVQPDGQGGTMLTLKRAG